MPSNRFLRRAARRADAAKSLTPAPTDPQTDDQGTDQPQSIQDDPKAMQLVDELEQMGYTADDVASAMTADNDQDDDFADAGDAATKAAAIQLPGMQ